MQHELNTRVFRKNWMRIEQVSNPRLEILKFKINNRVKPKMEILNLSFLSLIISLTALEYHNSGRDHFKCKSPALVYRYKLAVP